MLDGLSLIVIGGYLAVVTWNGKLDSLTKMLGNELGFVEWALAIGVLVAIYRNKTLGPIGQGLIFAAAIGGGLIVVKNGYVQQVLSQLKSGADPLKAASSTGAQSTYQGSIANPGSPLPMDSPYLLKSGEYSFGLTGE